MNRAATTRRNAEPRPIAEIVQEIYKRIIRTPRTRKNRHNKKGICKMMNNTDKKTAAEIIGNCADRFNADFGRAPMPGESCEKYIEYLKQIRPPQIARHAEEKPATPNYDTYTECQVLFIISNVLRACIAHAAETISDPHDAINVTERFAEYATENAGYWLTYPATKELDE